MKKFLFAALLAFLFSLPAHSQTMAGVLTVQGTLLNCNSTAGHSTSAVFIGTSGTQTNVTFVLSGTWAGTVTFYGTTNNGIQWSALSVTPTGGGSPVTSSTTNGSWGASVSTKTNFCAVSTAFTSGQIFTNVTLTTTGGGGGGNTTNQVVNGIPTNTGGDPTALDAIICPVPATIGLFPIVYLNQTAAATPPQCAQQGGAGRAVSGASSTDTILATDSAGTIIDHDAAGSSAVIFTVPTPTTLSNAIPIFLITNHSLKQDTIKATTWTIQAGSKAAVAGATGIPLPPGASARFSVDPFNATQWVVDTNISSGSCTEVWGGSGTSYAMLSGDDAISNNTCYNDAGVTRTITALKCRSDNAANTTVLTPTFGAAGTGTAILTGTLTCGNSYAYSATGTLNNTAWTTGTGIDPGMSTVGNATSIAMIVEYVY